MKIARSIVVPCLVAALASGCGSRGAVDGEAGADDAAAIPALGRAASGTPVDDALVGLWDVTVAVPGRGEDVQYYDIDAGGALTVYDYRGDGVDGGDNCHVRRDWTMTPLGDGEYAVALSADMPLGERPVFGLEVVDGRLRTSFPGDDEAGTHAFPSVVGTSAVDLALCES